jgi:hypothetical protein
MALGSLGCENRRSLGQFLGEELQRDRPVELHVLALNSGNIATGKQINGDASADPNAGEAGAKLIYFAPVLF